MLATSAGTNSADAPVVMHVLLFVLQLPCAPATASQAFAAEAGSVSAPAKCCTLLQHVGVSVVLSAVDQGTELGASGRRILQGGSMGSLQQLLLLSCWL